MNTPACTVLSLEDLEPGKMRVCTLGGRELVVCATRDGLYALDNICTHAYARLSEGRLRGNRLICPLHGAAFDVRDGRALGAPASHPLGMHPVRRIENGVEVCLAGPDTDPAGCR